MRTSSTESCAYRSRRNSSESTRLTIPGRAEAPMRASSCMGSPPAMRAKQPLSSTPLSRRCVDDGISSMSPRNSVPLRACSSSPGGAPAAPVPSSVAAALSSRSVRLSSDTNGPEAVGPAWCTKRAILFVAAHTGDRRGDARAGELVTALVDLFGNVRAAVGHGDVGVLVHRHLEPLAVRGVFPILHDVGDEFLGGIFRRAIDGIMRQIESLHPRRLAQALQY